jgi:hypothetical protein
MADEPTDQSRFLSDTILAALREALQGEGTVRECPVGRHDAWSYGDTTVRFLGVGASGKLLGDRAGFEVFPVWCERCGLLRLHAVQALMR